MARLGTEISLTIFFFFFFIGSSVVVEADWNILHFGGFRNRRYSDSLNKYCESWRVNVEVNNIRWFKAVPEECVSHVQNYMTSQQYKADSNKALEEVKLYLSTSRCCVVKDDGKDAWIFDVDDTLLSTIPYYKKHGFGGQRLNATSLEKWMGQSEAPALNPTLEIFAEIRDRGFKIFLVSSRREVLRSGTVDNLLDVGYHGWAGLTLRGLSDELLEVKRYKAAARQRLADDGFRIWGIIGDQWSSFEGSPRAERTFKLPNSIYYVD